MFKILLNLFSISCLYIYRGMWMHYHAYTLNQGLILRVHCNRKIEIETSQKK